ncbi:hypothetical protein H1R20_g8375, partial [Candolleomyces eurysporus]
MVAVHLLENPSDAQIESITQLLLRAHEGQLIVAMMSDSNRAIEEKWHRLGVRAGALEGKIWVVFDPDQSKERGDEDSSIVSVVVAFGPGVMPMGSEAQRALGLVDYLTSLSPENLQWRNQTYSPLVEKSIDESIGQQKPVDSWLPILVATDPEHQKRGYATALIRELQKTASADNTGVFLTTWNKDLESYYQYLGFEVASQIEIPSPLRNWIHRNMLWEDNSSLKAA